MNETEIIQGTRDTFEHRSGVNPANRHENTYNNLFDAAAWAGWQSALGYMFLINEDETAFLLQSTKVQSVAKKLPKKAVPK
jgi:hypothetical protein